MQREIRYFARQRDLQMQINAMGELRLSLAMQASFPDSGYYYANKHRELNRLHDRLKPKIRKDRWKRLWAHWEKLAEQTYYNYHVKVQVVTADGQEFTAADMDAAMAGY